jgi:hypothetical protein
MTEASGAERQGGERGAAEERSGAPLTPAEKRANQRPPGNPEGHEADSRMEGFAEASIDEQGGGGRSDQR